MASAPLERCSARARDEGTTLEQALLSQRLISDAALADVKRRLWLDRLVRGMARASAEGREPTPLQAHSGPTPAGPSTSLVTLVLDALERRAANEDAGHVGQRADHRLEWQPGPYLERGRRSL